MLVVVGVNEVRVFSQSPVIGLRLEDGFVQEPGLGPGEGTGGRNVDTEMFGHPH